MEIINIENLKFEKRIAEFAKFFQADLHNDCEEYKIKFNNRIGSGKISGIDFNHGIGLWLIDCQLNTDITINHLLGRRHPILFVYTSLGKISLFENKKNTSFSVKANEASIFAPAGDSNYSVILPKGLKIKSVIISIVRLLFLRKIDCDLDTIPNSLQKMFRDTKGKQSFFYHTLNEAIYIKSIEEILINQQSGLERKLLLEARTYEYITQMIKRFRTEQHINDTVYNFKSEDIASINKAKNILMDNLKNAPNIEALSKQVGLSENKLQEGVQLLFGKSIRQFLISIRMQKALKLLSDNELSIGEIAYEVGYTNKSHFSRQFKKEFGLLPSEVSIPGIHKSVETEANI